jgi:type VI secretion system protein ImpJ
MSPIPAWGLGSLQWDGFQLLEGTVSVQELTIVLPSGALIDIPGNARPVSFNLNATGLAEATLFVHLESDFDVTQTGVGTEPDEGVERVVQKVILSTKAHLDTAIHSFELARLCKTPDGQWQVQADYLPPLLKVGGSPLFEGYNAQLEALASRYHQQLVNEIQQNYLSGQTVITAKICLKSVFRLQATLAHFDAGNDMHPYELFGLLQNFYFDVCIYRDTDPNRDTFVYSHDRPGESFGALISNLEELLMSSQTEMPYVPFRTSEGMVVCLLPEAVRKAREVYWLLQKHRVGDEIDLKGFKLASASRVETVHRLSLGGIPFQRINNPPFHHDFGSEIEFYQLVPGEEWDHALRDGTLAYYDRNQLRDAHSYLYWRENE